MATVQEYYIVPKQVYEKCSEPNETLDEKISKVPKQAKYKIKHLLQFLANKIQWDSETGEISGLKQNIFDYINYTVRCKNKPVDWLSFIDHLIGAPSSLLCEKVKREVKKAKRQHGRHIHTSRVD